MPISAVLGFIGAQEQASATESAANTSANAQLEAARIAAAEARFRPVGVTTRFGKSNFQFGIPGVSAPVATDFATPEEFAAAQSAYQGRLLSEGRLTGAGYELDPRIKASQDRLGVLSYGALTQAEQAQQQYQPLQTAATGLFGLGQQYLAQSPQDVAAKYIQQQQDLLAPSRERQMAQLQNQLFQQGRGGLSVGATGMRPSGGMGLGATTPEMEAYYNAIAQQDAQLVAQAQEAGQRNVAFGTGLFGSGSQLLGQYQAGQVGALSPFTTYLGAGQAIESLGQESLRLGAELGGRASTAGANAGEFLFKGGSNAALTQQRGQGGSPLGGLLQGAAKDPRLQTGFERLFGGGQPVETGYTGSPYMQRYENDLLAQQGQYYNQQPSAFLYDSGPF
jgi:hypothetical protein